MSAEPNPEIVQMQEDQTSNSDGSTLQDHSEKEVIRLPGTIAEISLKELEKKPANVEEPVLEVTWDGEDDPANPQNWPKWKKWYVTLVVSAAILVANFGTSILTPGLRNVSAEFNVGLEVGVLSVSLYLIGFAAGPLFAAPLSEEYGRNALYIPFMAVFIILQIGVALVHNIGGFLFLRLLSGIAVSPPATLGAGTINDVWKPGFEQVVGVSTFLVSPFIGPVLGPIVGGYVIENVGWRWTVWILMIFAGLVLPFQIFAPETYAPILLYRKAIRLEKEGKNVVPPKFHPFRQVLMTAIKRPPRMLFTEPIVLLVALYAALVFGLLFTFFLVYPLVFTPIYGFSLGSRGLAFIGIGTGTLTGNISFIFLFLFFSKRPAFKEFQQAILGPVMIGAIVLPISLFWFGWTSRKNIHWIVPILAGFPFGFSMMLIFNGTAIFLSSSYQRYAASAFAVNSVLRYTFAAVFPLFATQMITGIGNGWSMTVMGCVSILMIPIPFLFYRYREVLKAKSPYLNPNSGKPIV